MANLSSSLTQIKPVPSPSVSLIQINLIEFVSWTLEWRLWSLSLRLKRQGQDASSRRGIITKKHVTPSLTLTPLQFYEASEDPKPWIQQWMQVQGRVNLLLGMTSNTTFLSSVLLLLCFMLTLDAPLPPFQNLFTGCPELVCPAHNTVAPCATCSTCATGWPPLV